MSTLKKLWVPIAALLMAGFAAFLAFSLRNVQGANLTGKFDIQQKLGSRVPMDAKFKDEYGQDVELRKYFGARPVILMPIFYKCRASCPLEFQGVTKVMNDMLQENAGRDYDVVSLSIHPKETPAIAAEKKESVLQLYKRPGASAGWHFLTGSEDQIKRVTNAIGFKYFYDPAKDQVVHPNSIMVLTPGGRVAKYFFGLEYPAKLMRDTLDAAGQETLAQRSEPILFGCFSSDPVTGKTQLVVMRATQVVGFATVLLLATSIFFMNKKFNREHGLGGQKADL